MFLLSHRFSVWVFVCDTSILQKQSTGMLQYFLPVQKILTRETDRKTRSYRVLVAIGDYTTDTMSKKGVVPKPDLFVGLLLLLARSSYTHQKH